MRKSKFWFFCLFFVFLASIYCTAKEEEYFFNKKATLTGTLIVKNFYGPPNYGETPKQDKIERHYVLKLDKKIDVISLGDTEGFDIDSEYGVEIIQITFTTKESIIKSFKNKKIQMTGILFPSINAQQHTPVMIEVKSIKKLGKK